MIPKECKRLAEVDFPIAEVSKHSAREKSIRHGHPSTLHLWWARRPLAACRAMLLGLLLPDPCDPLCPPDFKTKARELLPRVTGQVGPKDKDLRQSLLKFIADFANWDVACDPTYLEVGRGLVKAAHPEETPLVVDPFAGGGSIPLEALRLGCEAFASDLNPVACLILKVMLEDIPRHGSELAEELRRVGGEIKKAAEKELAEFYPRDPDGATPIAYLWARTVKCESPNCGAEIPLARLFWLCAKANRRRALRYKIHHRATEGTEKNRKGNSPCPLCLRGEFPHVVFEVFEPKSEKEVHGGTVARAKATCICCGAVLPPERVRAQLAEQRGGADVVFDSRNNQCREGQCATDQCPPDQFPPDQCPPDQCPPDQCPDRRGGVSSSARNQCRDRQGAVPDAPADDALPLPHGRGTDPPTSSACSAGATSACTEPAIPIAYLITINCYGHCLHGEETGSVDRRHNVYGTDFLPAQPGRRRAEQELMDQPPYEMDQSRRQRVLEAIREVCGHRGWGLAALHMRPAHIHAVVHAIASPEKVLNDFKTYASRSLNRAGHEGKERKRWARHGSTRYLWKMEEVAAAIHYVLHEQGEPMETHEGVLFPPAECSSSAHESPKCQSHRNQCRENQCRDREGAVTPSPKDQFRRNPCRHRQGMQGRNYRPPTERDYQAV